MIVPIPRLELSASATELFLALIAIGECCIEKELQGFGSLKLMLFDEGCIEVRVWLPSQYH